MLVIRMVIPWENWGPSFKNEPGRISCMAEPIDLDGMPYAYLFLTWTKKMHSSRSPRSGMKMKTTIIQIRYMLQYWTSPFLVQNDVVAKIWTA